MTTPAILMQRGVNNEAQDVEMTTVRLTPNSTSNFQTRFQIPRQGDILDSNSALVWTISWDGYNSSEAEELVLLKNFSGGLNTIQRARFYIGGREIFSCEDVGHMVHIKNLSRNPDYQEEVLDMELGSVHGYFDTSNGKYQLGKDTDGNNNIDVSGVNGIRTFYNRYARALGSFSETPSDNRGIECTLLLSDIFSALQSIQLPMSLEDMRLEIDWETDFNQVAYVAKDDAGSITPARKVISIQNPVLLLDYLTYPEDARAAFGQVLESGVAVPYIHTSISQKVIPRNDTATAQTNDILIALQGKLLMKIYVSHRLSDFADDGTTIQAPFLGNGRCRSQRGLDMSYNLFINDLSIHDLPVDTASQQYSFFSMAQQAMASVVPGSIEYNPLTDITAVANGDINSGQYTVSGVLLPPAVPKSEDITGPEIRNMVAGCQSYLAFDLAKYPKGSGARGGVVIPADAGYRNGSAPAILRLTQTGSATADSPPARPKTCQIFTEEVRVMQVRGGIVDVLEA